MWWGRARVRPLRVPRGHILTGGHILEGTTGRPLPAARSAASPPRPSPESPVAPQPPPSLPPRSLLGAAWRLAAQSLRSWRARRSSGTRKPSTQSMWEPGTRRAGALTFLLGAGVRSTSMGSTLSQTVKHGHGPGYDQVTKTHEAPRAALPPAAAEHQGSPGITAPPWPARPANHRAPTRGHGSPRCLPSRRLPPKAPAWPPPGWLPPSGHCRWAPPLPAGLPGSRSTTSVHPTAGPTRFMQVGLDPRQFPN